MQGASHLHFIQPNYRLRLASLGGCCKINPNFAACKLRAGRVFFAVKCFFIELIFLYFFIKKAYD